ncbi:membrane-spanning 4-domains subfamily A member 3-like [Mustela lutreola]|uniref:membrane-spanning 4-domains subfamily A member 3-like n=1 Tax=Mustela lutreola TaxID=9666 RepID=UPI00138716D1|nr:membrane-spanning 4-domains subfamily A member 3-like isoform X2 [Mustela erminea]XP_059014978.1 membrane-spanning 4-domains subfamily A member 3-like [Mustela lutreola]
MASQEVGNEEPRIASTGSPPASQAEPEVINNSVYQPIGELQNHLKEKLQAFGAVQILSGAIILVLGVFLGSLRNIFHFFSVFFFIFYTAYPLWGPIFFIVSGSLSVVTGRKPTRALVQNTFGMNIASATVALVGFVFLSINLAVNKQSFKNCEASQSQDLCIYVGIFSNGLMSVMLILTLLELCISISVSAMWCVESSRNSTEVISTPSNSV